MSEEPKLGRPTDYKPEYDEQARKLCLIGAIDATLADFFDVSEVTINAWKKKHPSFLKSLKKGKDIADSTVAESLFNRANGYSHPDVHISNFKGDITVTDITKHYPPESVAGIFWLKNRQPEHFRDKQEVEHSGSIATVTTYQIPDNGRDSKPDN